MVLLWDVWAREHADEEIGVSSELHPALSRALVLGERFTGPYSMPEIEFDTSAVRLKEMDCPTSNLPVRIVSPDLAAYLAAEVGEDIQLLDVELLAQDGHVTGYKIVNPLRHVFGIDKEKSSVRFSPSKEDENDIIGLNTFVSIPDCLGNYKIARDAELSYIYIAEELAEDILSHFSGGFAFIKPEDAYPNN